MSRVFERIAAVAARRPGRVLAVVCAIAALGAAFSLTLSPSAATETLVGRSSDAHRATERHRERFGDHAIAVLVRGSLADLVLTENLGRLLALEGCLAGNAPKDRPAAGGAGSPCDRLARTKPVQVVYGPGTFINAAVGEIQDQFRARLRAATADARRAGEAARRLARAQGRSRAQAERAAAAASDLVLARFSRDMLQTAVRYGIPARVPYLNDPDLVASLVFDGSSGGYTPKSRFAYLFPGEDSALISVRLDPRLDAERRAEATDLIRRAVAMPEWRLNGGSYTVTGAPVLVEDLADALAGSLLELFAVALVVMALVLVLVFRSRLRLVPLAVALGAVGATFGLMAAVGAPLTMAAVAALPVLLGLGVDYAIQYQARVEEAEADADTPTAVRRAARTAAPTIAVAGLATVAGFLVLTLSPVPMVRGFGVLLVAGVLLAFLFALSAGTAALVASARAHGRPGGPLTRSARGAGELVDAARGRLAGRLRVPGRALSRAGRRATALAMARPAAVLAAGAALALGGWALDSRTEVVSDVERLVPQDLPAVRDLRALQERTGVAGEVDVLVEGRDLTDPAVVAWMRDYQQDLLDRYGWSPANGCGRAELCPGLSLPDLFRSERTTASRAQVRALLDAVPPYFSRAVITRDRRTASLAFGIKLLPLERQQEIVEAMRASLDPPPGVRARVAGLPVLAAEANAALSSPWRRLGTLAVGLLAVALVLLVAYRSWRRAWVPLVPIALATGWSALVLWLLHVPLNPLSAALGALVIAISTEFSVLLCARYEEERARADGVAAALRRTYASTGAAVLASGTTAIAGFAVLAFSDVRMLRDFGLVTVVDLTVSLLGVLAVLPAVLVLVERRRRRPMPAGEPAPPDPALVA